MRMQIFDANHSGTLNRKELSHMLSRMQKRQRDNSATTLEEAAHTVEETEFVLRVADTNGNGVIDLAEVSAASSCWHSYLTSKFQTDLWAGRLPSDLLADGKIDNDQLQDVLNQVRQDVLKRPAPGSTTTSTSAANPEDGAVDKVITNIEKIAARIKMGVIYTPALAAAISISLPAAIETVLRHLK